MCQGNQNRLNIAVTETEIRLVLWDFLSEFVGPEVHVKPELVQVAKAGCDAALVATALHDGRISATDIAAARDL